MIYLDLTPREFEKLIDFHNTYPQSTLRVYSDEIISIKDKTYRKRVTDLDGHETDIAEPTFE